MVSYVVGLLLLGVGVGFLLRWSKGVLEARGDALRAFGARQGLRVRDDGQILRVVGGHRGRAFSLTWIRKEPPVLLVGVDCAAVESEQQQVQDGALLSRWTSPPPELFEEERLKALIQEMVLLAEEQELRHPAPPEID